MSFVYPSACLVLMFRVLMVLLLTCAQLPCLPSAPAQVVATVVVATVATESMSCLMHNEVKMTVIGCVVADNSSRSLAPACTLCMRAWKCL